MSFINKYSWKCLLGSLSKDPKVIGNIATWYVGKNKIKKHFTLLGDLNNNDVLFLKEYGSCNFHYISENNLLILKESFKINKSRYKSTIIDITNQQYIGRKYHGIRGAINKNSKLGLTIQSNFNNINDIKSMLDQWSDDSAEKYFRDFSGKNLFFYKQNYHINCLNTFIYDKTKLVAFSSLSPDESSSYIIGKALCKEYPGLSEYADVISYKRALNKNIKTVNLGQSKGGVGSFKNKFPNTQEIIHYDGKITC